MIEVGDLAFRYPHGAKPDTDQGALLVLLLRRLSRVLSR